MRAVLILWIVFFAQVVFAQNPTLKLASDVWPPFTNHPGEAAFAQDIVKEALNRNGISIEFVTRPFSEVVAGIKSGEYAGSAALWINDDRQEWLTFSIPYLQNQLILVGRKGSDVRARTFAVLAGKKVAIVEKYAYGAAVDTAHNVSFIKGRNDQENLDRLLRGEVDYMLVDDLLIQYLLNTQADRAREYLAIGEHALIRQQLYFALNQDVPDADALINGFNQEIISMVADGTYNELLRLNWISADVDGDGKMELVMNGTRVGKKAPSSFYELTPNLAGTNNSEDIRYYINGNFYDDWEKVPQEYKLPPQVSEKDLSTIGAIGLSF
jgi:ABC-type amino acid transport substrate-binding protein